MPNLITALASALPESGDKDFSYFSPTFLLDDDGTPAGLPGRGPLGALVDEPAFGDVS
jgi:hypothetical protein